MLLALSASPNELVLEMISVTYGNVDVQSCLRNVISVFHFIEKERAWRKSQGLPQGFETLDKCKPFIAVGANEPLADQMLMADYFHGVDGLGGIHHSHPHLSPEDTWKDLFKPAQNVINPAEPAALEEMKDSNSLFTPSLRPAHVEMLRLLRENPPDTITIVAIGPLTNCAVAAATDPETFLRAKEVVIMGGTLDWPGNVTTAPFIPPLNSRTLSQHSITPPPFNLIKQPDVPLRRSLNIRNQITPVAEFNTYADSIAAARVFALTSPNPTSTMPPVPPAPPGKVSTDPPPPFLAPYPKKLSRQLNLTLVPLDITSLHTIDRNQMEAVTRDLEAKGSPMAEWVTAFMSSTFDKVAQLHQGPVSLQLHDPLCIWYLMTPTHTPAWQLSDTTDVRIETSGQWTRGMMVVDKRDRHQLDDNENQVEETSDEVLPEIHGDHGNWLSKRFGNRIRWITKSPGEERFAGELLARVFGNFE
jgi:inosine-uridine nucleoside N-ribohydrolase